MHSFSTRSHPTDNPQAEVGWQNATPLNFDPKPSDAAFSSVFEFDKCRPEVVGDVISGVIVGWTGTDAL